MSRGLTLDTGALIGIERRRKRAMTLIAEARLRGHQITVPTPVVVEWWRDQQGTARRALDGFVIEELTEKMARVAGVALKGLEGPSATDAVVMASAASRGDVVLTSDIDDLEMLRSVFPAVKVLRV